MPAPALQPRADGDNDQDEVAEGQLEELLDQYRELMDRVKDLESQIDDLMTESSTVKEDAAQIWRESGLDEQEDGELNPDNWD